MNNKLSKETIMQALGRLDELLREKGVIGELCIFGGAAMVLAFDARECARDLDAIFTPRQELLDCSKQVGEEMDFELNWLSDGVKVFVSPSSPVTSEGMPEFANLRITRPSTEYLLAMKCLASRVADYSAQGDKRDVITLLHELKIYDAEKICDIIQSFDKGSIFPVKVRFFVQEVIDEIQATNCERITLKQSMASITEREDFSYALRNFLDRFYSEPCPEQLKDEPTLLVDVLKDEGLADAYLASTAASLCQKYNLPQPAWVDRDCRVKKTPWFAAKSPNLKAILLQESPAAFRVRNLFVSANALSRA